MNEDPSVLAIMDIDYQLIKIKFIFPSHKIVAGWENSYAEACLRCLKMFHFHYVFKEHPKTKSEVPRGVERALKAVDLVQSCYRGIFDKLDAKQNLSQWETLEEGP